MSKVKFIDTVFLKENTTIQDNVDDDFLISSIYMVQDTHLQQALGTTFYNRLKQGVIDDDLNANELSLITTYIQNMVCRWTFYEVIPFINYKFTNKAVSKESSEWSQNSELNEVRYLQEIVRDQAEFYTKRLQVFLCDNDKTLMMMRT
jgi:hypothetical protein